MQFFPFPEGAFSVSALHGLSAQADKVLAPVAASANEFLAELNEQLAAQGITPVEAPFGAPKGFRSLAPAQEALQSEDLRVLRDSLKKRGLADDQLGVLEAMVNSGQPMTMSVLVNALTGKKRSGASLTDEERQHLGSALRKMGFSQDETQAAESLMDQGRNTQALRFIHGRLNALEAGAGVTLDKAEVRSLARGLDLSNNTAARMAALFGKSDEITAGREGLLALFAHADKELATRDKGAASLEKHLPAAINDALQHARFRQATAPDSDARASRKAERAQTRMRDSLTAAANNLGPEALAERARLLAREAGQAGGEDRPDAWNQGESPGENGKKASVLRRDAGNDAPAARKEDRRPETAARNSFAGHVRAEGIFSATPPLFSGAAGQPGGAAKVVPQELFAQVEKSVLRELADGSRQITLRLNPEEMGQLTILLTVRQGEVRAVLRTDNEETTAALSQQMEQLKSSLEEQGLKVARLEVETRLPDNAANQHWDNASQYNREQELRDQARFLQLARMRQEAGSGMARNMQNTPTGGTQREEISGLHIIA